MAAEVPTFVQSYTAGADLSAKQYYAVKFSANNTVTVCAALTDVPCGILQNAPASGGSAVVMHLGKSKVSSDAALSVGDMIGPSGDGQLDARTIGTDTTHYVMGQVCKASAAAGGKATAIINGINPLRAA